MSDDRILIIMIVDSQYYYDGMQKSWKSKCSLLTTAQIQMIQMILLSQWMVNENVKMLIVNIRRLTVCSNNSNVNDGMNLVPFNKTVRLIKLMYNEQMCYKYSALSSMLE